MPDPQPKSGKSISPCQILKCRDGLSCSNDSRKVSQVNPRPYWHAGVLAILIALFTVFIGATGCGTGDVAFDGGHIPTGGGTFASVVAGVAVDAEAVSVPVVGAIVTVTNTSATGVRETQTAVTSADGSFTFTNSFPDIATVNQFTMTVTPPSGSSRSPQQLTFPVNGGQPVNVMVAMPNTSFDESQATAVTILQQAYSFHKGTSIEVGAEVLGTQGSVLAGSPSLVFTGAFGYVQAGGLFTSTGTGTGAVSAYWYTGVALLQSNPATVSVVSSSTILPPPPPEKRFPH